MKNWKTQLTANGADLGTVQIKRGIFQGDSLSPLLFVTSLIPVTIILRSLKQGYSLDKKTKINHLLYMDDLKLYGKSNNEIDTLIQTVRICTTDIGMKFGLDKCGVLAMKRGKVTACEGIMLNDEEVIGDVSVEGYKYLGIIERGDIAHEEMKQKTRKEYLDRVRKVMKSKLNGGNVIKAINTWAIPLIRYGAGIIDWTKNEIDEIDRKTRKMLNMYGGLHPKSNVDRLYLKRENGGRGLISVGDFIINERNNLGLYAKDSSENFIVFAERELKLKERIEDGSEKTRRERRTKSWHEKTLHGQFIRETEKVADKQSWSWLKQGDLKRETESLIFAAQEQALRTNAIKASIDKQNISPACRMCGNASESVTHITSACQKLAQTQYKHRHDKVGKKIHWLLSKKYNLECTDKWYQHSPEPVAENEEVKILLDFMIQTDRVIEHRRPDIVVVEKIGGKCFIVDIAVPGDHNVQQKELEKKTKYEDLRIEIARLWNKEVSVIPVVVGALGTLTANLKKNLKELGIPNVIPCLQKSALLGTASILRRTLGISGSG